jgi:hypothetical protein
MMGHLSKRIDRVIINTFGGDLRAARRAAWADLANFMAMAIVGMAVIMLAMAAGGA